jgi:large subunit ribosomal protein L3
MNIQSLVGRKIDQTQGFLEDGTRVPLSIISMGQNVVSQVKTVDTDGYSALQIGFDTLKRPNKPTEGHTKKAGLSQTPRFFREIKADGVSDVTAGTLVTPSEIFEPGDIVDVVGTSKGKGYAGVVKRHGFHGGPKTHGQSDRHRAPGSIGQTTTPGRVYKGKRMSGRMGNERVTVKNLEVLDIQGETILIRGLIPGAKGAIVTVKKVGKNKKFMPLWSEKAEIEETEVATAEENVQDAKTTVETPEEKVETAETTVQQATETVQTEESSNETAEKAVEAAPATEASSEENKTAEISDKSEGGPSSA